MYCNSNANTLVNKSCNSTINTFSSNISRSYIKKVEIGKHHKFITTSTLVNLPEIRLPLNQSKNDHHFETFSRVVCHSHMQSREKVLAVSNANTRLKVLQYHVQYLHQKYFTIPSTTPNKSLFINIIANTAILHC